MSELADLLRDAQRVVAFTGAGISTESGIPDFRSPGGVWTKYDPREFTFDKFVRDPEVRKKAWGMRDSIFANNPQPNAAHHALARLEQAGRAGGVITQNIDGLHQEAGSSTVIEIHGTSRKVMCIGHPPLYGAPDGCGFVVERAWANEQIEAGHDDLKCPECGGIIKSATISFGQAMPADAMEAAVALVQTADLVLTIGSSLQVYPAAEIPMIGVDAGAKMAIVNREPTPFDQYADVVVNGSAGEILPPAVDAALS